MLNLGRGQTALEALKAAEAAIETAKRNAARGIMPSTGEAATLIKDYEDAKKAVDEFGNKVSSAATDTQGIAGAAGNAKEALASMASVSFGGLISQIQEAMTALSQLASAKSATMNAAHGGVAYLASGGKGTDTISAMLSPGEMVMNAAASNKFATQLSAMNAGMQPTYNQQSNQTNIGDIHVHVNGAQSPQSTAREVMQAMRREMRRGTGIL
jgi:hypothetical protein